MNVSIIIPTFNRSEDLRKALESVLDQTLLPAEIVMVDDSTNDDTIKMINSLRSSFERREIGLNYIRKIKREGLPKARNIGINNSKGDIILFLDDDVILDKHYIEEIIKVYANSPNVKGVQGYWANGSNLALSTRFLNALSGLFFHFHYKENDCSILSSFEQTYPLPLTKIILSECFSGCNFSYYRSIFNEFRFDEKLKKYALGEDRDLSYRVFMKYPFSMYTTPYAKLIHNQTPVARMNLENRIYLRIIYWHYLFYKNMNRNLKNRIAFLWSIIGEIIFIFAGLFIPRSFSRRVYLDMFQYYIRSMWLCEKHKSEIIDGDLEFFNKDI